MPNTDQKADILFKKDLGLATTNSGRAFFEEPYPSRPFVLPSQIWAQADQIPNTAPSISTGVVQRVTNYTLSAIVGVTNSFRGDLLKDAIPFNFGDGTSYNYSLTNSVGGPIYFGVCDWTVDTEGGILMFNSGVPTGVSITTPPKISFWRYSGYKGISGGSGSIDTGMFTCLDTGQFYPRYSNPSGYVRNTETGHFIDTNETGNFATTGWVDTYYYPRSNPSGYITGVDTGSFVTTGMLTCLDTGQFATTGWVDTNYYPRSNPSGFFWTGADIVLPNPFSVKARDISGDYLIAQTAFMNNGRIAEFPVLYDISTVAALDWENRILLSTAGTPQLNWQSHLLTGTWYASGLYASGYRVLTTADTGSFGGGTGVPNYPTGGLSGQFLKKASNTTDDVKWGDTYEPYNFGNVSGNVVIDYLSGQFQEANLTGNIILSTANRTLGRFCSIKMYASGNSFIASVPNNWLWFGDNYSAGNSLSSGATAILSVSAYGTGEGDTVAIARRTDELPVATTGFVDSGYYPRSNPSGYISQTYADAHYYPLNSNPSGYITTGQTGAFGGGGSATYPTGGFSGQYLKKHTNANNDVEWGDVLNAYEFGITSGNKTIDFLSGQFQEISINSTTTFSTANRALDRFASIRINNSGTSGCGVAFPFTWTWIGDNYTSGFVLSSGAVGILSLACYGTGDANIIASCRRTDETNPYLTTGQSGIFATTGWVDMNYYPRSNPSGYIQTSQTGQFYSTGNPAGYIDSSYGNSHYYPLNSNPSGYLTSINTGAFVPSGGLTNQVLTKSSNLNYDDFWSHVPLKQTIMLCAAFSPSVSGADNGEIPVPYDFDGVTSLPWTARRINWRVQTAGSSGQISIEKSTVTGLFTPTTLGTLNLASGSYETFITGLGTLNSNDKVRFNVINSGTSLNWTVTLEISYP